MEHWVGDNPLAAIAADLCPPHNSVRQVDPRPGLGITVDETAVRRLVG